MKCLACGMEHNEKKCPRCYFPVVNITGNYEEGVKTLQPTIEKYRSEFSEKVELSLLTYLYEVNQTVTFQGNEKISFGRVCDLFNQTTWLETEFTNIAERKSIPISLCVAIENQPAYQITTNVPNLPSDTLQLGIEIDRTLRFHFVIRDAAGHCVSSETQPIVQ